MATDMLAAIRVLNALLSFGVSGLAAAQRWGQVIERAQEQNRAISDDEWAKILDAKEAADQRLAASIEQAKVRQ